MDSVCRRRVRRRGVRRPLTLALLAAPLAVGAPGASLSGAPEGAARGEAEPARAPRPGACTAEVTDRFRLRSGGRDLYVEAQVLEASESGLLVAGSPVYEWSADSLGAAALEQGRLLGVRVEAGRVLPIERPPGLGPLERVRAARLGPGRWGWLFEEVRSADPRERSEPIRVSFAEHDGGRWSELETVVAAGAADYRGHSASALVRVRDTLRWVLPENGRAAVTNRLRLLERHGSVWRQRILDSARWDAHLVEAVQIEPDGSGGWWMALSGPQQELGYRRSLRIARGADPGTLIRLYEGAPREQLVFPRLAAGSGEVVAAWTSRPGDGSSSAWGAVVEDPPGRPAALRIDPGAVHVVPLRLDDGHRLWVTQHADPESSVEELRVYRYVSSADAPELIGSFPQPFTGFFAAVATTGSELVLAGAQISADPAYRVVRSLFLRLSITCT